MTTLTLKYRLYPSKEQEEELERHIDICRQLYNHLLEQIKNDPFLSKTDQQNTLPGLKEEWTELNDVHSKTLQMVNHRLHSNISRLEEDRDSRPGAIHALRFKGKGWYNSFTYNQSGYKIKETGNRHDQLHLSKIGDIPIQLHRPIQGDIKQITVKKYDSDKWFACIQVETEPRPKPTKDELKAVGIDLGLNTFAVDTEGKAIGHPKNLRRAEQRLAKDQQDLSRKEKGSENWKKQKTRVAKLHDRAKNQRRDFLHKLSTAYVQNHDIIAVEDLSVKNMVQNRSLSKSISDSGWRTFIEMLSYKASKAGKTVVKVNPSGTTTDCSVCGEPVEKELEEREHLCPECGTEMHRDYNAARNVLYRGIEKLEDLGKGQAEDTPVDTGPLQNEGLSRISASQVVEAGSSVLTETRQESKVRAE